MFSADQLAGMSPEQIANLSRDEQLLAWQDAASKATMSALREKILREAAFKNAFPEATEGTNTIELGGGYLCKGILRMNYSVADTPEMRKQFIAALGSEQAARTVKFKPELSIKEWKDVLTQEQRDKLAAHVTTKLGLPALQILAPGDAGNKQP